MKLVKSLIRIKRMFIVLTTILSLIYVKVRTVPLFSNEFNDIEDSFEEMRFTSVSNLEMDNKVKEYSVVINTFNTNNSADNLPVSHQSIVKLDVEYFSILIGGITKRLLYQE